MSKVSIVCIRDYQTLLFHSNLVPLCAMTTCSNSECQKLSWSLTSSSFGEYSILSKKKVKSGSVDL
ncbi:hypothetical protein BLOT_010176 [Blomia tropicalis]|nr:hypothetical protein BLOT_010176 [Blomia tropicalis]